MTACGGSQTFYRANKTSPVTGITHYNFTGGHRLSLTPEYKYSGGKGKSESLATKRYKKTDSPIQRCRPNLNLYGRIKMSEPRCRLTLVPEYNTYTNDGRTKRTNRSVPMFDRVLNPT